MRIFYIHVFVEIELFFPKQIQFYSMIVREGMNEEENLVE